MKKLICCAVAFAAFAGVAFAGELKVEQGVITTQISNRQPVDEVKSTSASVGKLYCFTKIVGADTETTVTHVWSQAGNKVFEMKFPVKGASWRVYSAKTIYPEMKGEWKVDVVDAAGKVLATIPFSVH